jgi:EmrB/QacA subfamily drug resistance transporter
MPPQHRWTLVATILGSSMTFVDATVVNVALPALQADLGATITDVQWVIEAYALFLGALILVGGSLGDQFGRKRVFLTGVIWFTAASIFCGLATSASFLIVGRALQGIGAAFLVPGSLAIISATFGDADRGRAIGTWSGFSAITAAIGPVTGGWLIEHVGWRSVFFVNVPLAAAVLALSLLFMRESRDTSRSHQIDWTGAVLAILALGGIVFGLLEWPPLGAGHPLVLGSLVTGAVSLGLLPIVERRARSPMMPLNLFRSRTFTLANLLTLLLYAALGVILFLVPLNLIQVQGYSATGAGAAILPFPVIMFAMSRWSGGLVVRVGSRLPLTAGPVIAALGVALYARPDIGGSYWTTFFPAVVVLGLGMAVTVAPLTTTVMGAVDTQHAGVASGINNAVARVAGLLAIAVFGVLLARTFEVRAMLSLDSLGLTAPVRTAIDRELPKMAGADVEVVSSLDPSQRATVRRIIDEAFVAAFRFVMLGAAALALLASATGAAIRSRSGVGASRSNEPRREPAARGHGRA